MKKIKAHAYVIFLLAFPVAFLFTTSLFFAIASAADVTLAWDANNEENLAGYKLYYDGDSDTELYQGTGVAEGDSPIVIYVEDLADKDAPEYTLTGLEEGQYYYFALTAFDTDGLESDFSDEVGSIINSESNLISNASAAADSGDGGSGCFISGAIIGSHTTEPPMAATGILIVLGVFATIGIRISVKM